MSDRHLIAALERVPAIVEAYLDGNEPEAVRLLRRIPLRQWEHVVGYLLGMTYKATTVACGGDEDRARIALLAAVNETVQTDLVETQVRSILRDAATKEGLNDV